MTTSIAVLLAAAAGYAASVFTWPWVRAWWRGLDSEIAGLRAKAQALETTLRGG